MAWNEMVPKRKPKGLSYMENVKLVLWSSFSFLKGEMLTSDDWRAMENSLIAYTLWAATMQSLSRR